MPRGKFIDLTGQKFGRLTVLRRGQNAISKKGDRTYPQWECMCDCGKIVLVRGACLRNGNTQSCGCLQKERTATFNRTRAEQSNSDDIYINNVFGNWKVIERIEKEKTSITYLCKCIDCDNKIQITRSELLNNSKICKCKKPLQHHYKDITGQRFGKLTALYPTKANERRCMMWMFQCDCGNLKEIEGQSVTRGNTLSCGCLKQSHGELIIEQLLKKNHIPYKKEVYGFNYDDNANAKARFDFQIDNYYFIEFDGEQHFKSNDRWWNTTELVEKYKDHDRQKDEWCKKHNIPLIRIPYTHLNDLCIEDLQLETTTFRII